MSRVAQPSKAAPVASRSKRVKLTLPGPPIPEPVIPSPTVRKSKRKAAKAVVVAEPEPTPEPEPVVPKKSRSKKGGSSKPKPKVDKGKARLRNVTTEAEPFLYPEVRSGEHFEPLVARRIAMPPTSVPEGGYRRVREPNAIFPHLKATKEGESFADQVPMNYAPPYVCQGCIVRQETEPCVFDGWGNACSNCYRRKLKCSYAEEDTLALVAGRELAHDQSRACPSGESFRFHFIFNSILKFVLFRSSASVGPLGPNGDYFAFPA